MGANPRALDLFCGAGGASKGLADAGFDVVGVDIAPQPHYVHPGRFVRADALDPPFCLDRFDLIWASPPCQAYSSAAHYMRARGKVYPDLIGACRRMLASADVLTVIENVRQAPIRADVVLDGTMFPGLKVIRRRHFEVNFAVPLRLGFDATGHVKYKGWSCVAGGGRPTGCGVKANAWHTADKLRAAMGIDWMPRKALSQAVPPPYAEFIGTSALRHLDLIPDPCRLTSEPAEPA